MPSYRIEVSPNNRAGCKDTQCKKDNVKILKGEIRFGSWVEIKEHGSWSWKHWGCVSGSQIENIRDAIEKGADQYEFDAIDGYDEIEDEDLRAKIRRVIQQGHIDPEDFKGDPEYNVLGQKGIRGRAKKSKNEDEGENDDDAADSPKATPAKGKKGKGAGAKRSRKDAEADEEDAEEQPAAKKPKGRGRSKKAKLEDEDEEAEKVKQQVAKGKAKAGKAARVKQEAQDHDFVNEPTSKLEEEEDEVEDKEPVLKGKAKGGKAARVKKEEQAETEDVEEPPLKKVKVKAKGKGKKEDVGNGDEIATRKTRTSARGKRAVKNYAEEASDQEDEDEDVPELAPKKKAPAKGKRASQKTASKGKRGTAKTEEDVETESDAFVADDNEADSADQDDFDNDENETDED